MNSDDTERMIEAVEQIAETMGRIAAALEAIEAHLDAVIANDGKRDWLRWRPIDENTPRHGNYARVSVEEGLLYCPGGGEATHWLPLRTPEKS